MPLNKALRRLYKSIALVVTMRKRGGGGVGSEAKRASDFALDPTLGVGAGAAADSADSTSPDPLSIDQVQAFLAPSPPKDSAQRLGSHRRSATCLHDLNYATNDPLSNSIVITPEVLSALYTIASSSVLLVAFISMTDVG
jgi:hypothetical protein